MIVWALSPRGLSYLLRQGVDAYGNAIRTPLRKPVELHNGKLFFRVKIALVFSNPSRPSGATFDERPAMSTPAAKQKPPFYRSLYLQVLTAVIIGVVLGHVYPEFGAQMKPLGDGFIKLIKMLIAPIIFCTVVVGIAGMEDMKKVGKTGGLALLYFEIVSSIALLVGLVTVNLIAPGAGMNVDASTLDTKGIAAYTGPGKMQGTVDFC